jgi:hypothetical protein
VASAYRRAALRAKKAPGDTFLAAFRACYGNAIVVDRRADRWELVCVDPDAHQYPTTEVSRAFWPADQPEELNPNTGWGRPNFSVVNADM